MNDFLGGMNPGFPSSFLSVVEESAPTNKLTNAAIRESKTVLSDKGALKQQANSDRFNNQTEGAVPVAQNDIEPPKADDYQRLAQRMGSGPVVDLRASETRALTPFVPILNIPEYVASYRVDTMTERTIDIPPGAKTMSLSGTSGVFVSFTGKATGVFTEVLDGSGSVYMNLNSMPHPVYYCGNKRAISVYNPQGTLQRVCVAFTF